jgi:hypothetical protein
MYFLWMGAKLVSATNTFDEAMKEAEEFATDAVPVMITGNGVQLFVYSKIANVKN